MPFKQSGGRVPESHDEWAERAARLLPPRGWARRDDAVEALYNKCAFALREGRLREQLALQERLKARSKRAAAVEEAKRDKAHQLIRSHTAVKERLGAAGPGSVEGEWHFDEEVEGHIAETYIRESRYPPWLPDELYDEYRTDPLEKPPLGEALERLEAYARSVVAEMEAAREDRERFLGMSSVIHTAIENYEYLGWPPMWADLDDGRPRVLAPDPLDDSTVVFVGDHAWHKPFERVLVRYYLWLRDAEGVPHREAVNGTLRWHDEKHGPIIKEKFGEKTMDRRVLLEYIKAAGELPPKG